MKRSTIIGILLLGLVLTITVGCNSSSKETAGTQSAGSSAKSQIGALLADNWAKAKAAGIATPDLSIDKFVKTSQSAAGEPKPTVARVLKAIEKLNHSDVVITPNLVADTLIEMDKE